MRNWAFRGICSFILILNLIGCKSQVNSKTQVLQPADVIEIRIQSPYQNLKILRVDEHWEGTFLPQSISESQETHSFKTYQLDPDKVHLLIEVFLNLQKNPTVPAADDVKLSIKTPSEERNWTISKADPLRRLVLLPSTDWRSKKVFDQEASRIEEIRFPLLRPPLVLARAGDQWIWPDNPEQKLSQELIQSLARKISRLKALSLAEYINARDAGLDPPQAELIVRFKGDSTEFRVLLGKQKFQNLFYAQVKGLVDWEGEIFIVNEESAEKFRMTAAQILEKREK